MKSAQAKAQTVEYHSIACPRVPMRRLGQFDEDGNYIDGLVPRKYLESLERNQQLASCCRHPENHEFSAWYSSPRHQRMGVPDIFKNHCTCGRIHVRLCVETEEQLLSGEAASQRPFWYEAS